MWSKVTTKFSSILVIIAFSAAVLFSSNTLNAQSLHKPGSDVPQSTTTTPVSSDNGTSSKTIIYVAMGAAIVGAILYKFVFHKDSESDSTKSETSSILLPKNTSGTNSFAELSEKQNQLPVNLYLSVRRDAILPDQKTYMVGLSFNF